MPDIDDTVDAILDECGLDAVEDSAAKGKENPREARRDQWVTLASCILAVISAIAGLYASFYSDRAQDALNEAAVAATEYASSASEASLLELNARLLARENKPVPPEVQHTMDEARAQAAEARHKMETARAQNDHLDDRHDWLAIAITLFQVAIVLSSIGQLVHRNLPLGFATAASSGGLYALARFFLMG